MSKFTRMLKRKQLANGKKARFTRMYCQAIVSGNLQKVRHFSNWLKKIKTRNGVRPFLFTVATRKNCQCWYKDYGDFDFHNFDKLSEMIQNRQCHCLGTELCQRWKRISPLHLASYYGKTEIVRFLVKQDSSRATDRKHKFLSPLMMASLCQDEVAAKATAEILLNAENDMDAEVEEFRFNLLHCAVLMNRPNLAKLLLSYRINANGKSKAGFSPIWIAPDNECSEILIASGAKILESWPEICPFTRLLMAGKIEQALLFCDRPEFNLYHRYRRGHTHSFYEVMVRHYVDHELSWEALMQIFSKLLAAGLPCRPDIVNWAVKQKRLDLLRLLVSHGTDIEFLGCNVMSALITAYFFITPEVDVESSCIPFLLESGADIHALYTFNQNTVIAYAVSMEVDNVDLVRPLLDRNVDIGSLFQFGVFYPNAPRKSLLWGACYKGNFNIARLLVNYGLDMKKEGWLMEEWNRPEALKKNEKFLAELISYHKTPFALIHLCRNSIRRLLRRNILHNVIELNLPKPIMNFLLCK